MVDMYFKLISQKRTGWDIDRVPEIYRADTLKKLNENGFDGYGNKIEQP